MYEMHDKQMTDRQTDMQWNRRTYLNRLSDVWLGLMREELSPPGEESIKSLSSDTPPEDSVILVSIIYGKEETNLYFSKLCSLNEFLCFYLGVDTLKYFHL